MKNSDSAEYAGINISSALKIALKSESLTTRLVENSWNQSAQLIVPTTPTTNPFETLSCTLHTVEESNDWTNPRTTGSDMTINKAASLLANLLEEQQNSNEEFGRINSA